VCRTNVKVEFVSLRTQFEHDYLNPELALGDMGKQFQHYLTTFPDAVRITLTVKGGTRTFATVKYEANINAIVEG
jgi:hypothetical protein